VWVWGFPMDAGVGGLESGVCGWVKGVGDEVRFGDGWWVWECEETLLWLLG
jgi:hypothetical protein